MNWINVQIIFIDSCKFCYFFEVYKQMLSIFENYQNKVTNMQILNIYDILIHGI